MIARLRVLCRIYDKVLEVKLLLEAQTGIGFCLELGLFGILRLYNSHCWITVLKARIFEHAKERW